MEITKEELQELVTDIIDGYYDHLVGIFSSPEEMDKLKEASKEVEPDLDWDSVIIPILRSMKSLKAKVFTEEEVSKEDLPSIDHLIQAIMAYGVKNDVDITQDEGSIPADSMGLYNKLSLLAFNLLEIKTQVKDQES